MKIYVASSWRNQHQQAVVAALRAVGHEVYDFKNPRPGDHGFHWSEIDPAWKTWTPEAFREGLESPIAEAGFRSDMDALRACDACVLVLPCGRSAHLELGWAAGAGKRTAVLMLEPNEPELMYRMLHQVCTSVDEVVTFLARPIHLWWNGYDHAVGATEDEANRWYAAETGCTEEEAEGDGWTGVPDGIVMLEEDGTPSVPLETAVDVAMRMIARRPIPSETEGG